MNWIDEFCGAPTSITTWLFPAIIGPLQIVTGLSQARSVMAMRREFMIFLVLIPALVACF